MPSISVAKTSRLNRMVAALSAILLLSAPALAQEPLTARFAWFDYRGADPIDGSARVGKEQYRNPILQGFYSDPSTTRVGEDYYLVSSTFAYFPGLPIFRSRDLVNWTQIGNAIDRPTQLDFTGLRLSRGVFAPQISHHGDLFYILNTCVDCGGNFLITAKDPSGPWSDPVWLPQVDGIDPSLFFDDDGRAWIVNNGPPVGTPRYDGHRAIWIQQFDPVTQKTFGPRAVLVDGGVDPSTRPIWIEGPRLLKREGRYYLTAAEGGTAEGHSQVVLRADSVTGPYVPYADNPILTQRDLPKNRPMPITSAGHADLFQTPKGDWWATFLAVRPYGDDLYNTGREAFLLPVEWKDGWPVILKHGVAVPYVAKRPDLPPQPPAPQPTSGAFHVRTEFDGTTLPPDWMMLRNPRERWWRLDRGDLVLAARTQGIGDMANPSFLGRRQQHLNASAETEMLFTPRRDGDRAGMVVLQNDDYYYFLGVVREGGRNLVRLEKRAGPKDPRNGVALASVPLPLAPGKPIQLGIDAHGGAYDFRYALTPGAWQSLKTGMDGTILSTKVAGGFVGAVMGVYASEAPGP